MTTLELLYTTEEDFQFLKDFGLVETFDIVAEHLAECFSRETTTKVIHGLIERIQADFIDRLIDRIAKAIYEGRHPNEHKE